MNEEEKKRSDKLSRSQKKISNPVTSWKKKSQKDVGGDNLTDGHKELKCQARGVITHTSKEQIESIHVKIVSKEGQTKLLKR